jgi:pyruvate formate lyase activating enzyme
MAPDATRTKEPLKGLIFNIQKFSLNDGPGIRTVVFFKGCPLRCKWCSNPESQLGKPEPMFDSSKNKMITCGKFMTIDEVMDEVMKDKAFYDASGGGVTFSGGEVLFQAKFAIELAKRLKAEGIHLACETTGYVKSSVFMEFMKYIDFMYYDCKQWDPMLHKKGTGKTNEIILKNLDLALKYQTPKYHKKLCIRIPVIPGFNYTDNDAENFGKLFVKMGVKHVELLPFHQFGLKKYEELHREYALKNVAQLTSDDLLDYQKILAKYGVQADINGWD